MEPRHERPQGGLRVLLAQATAEIAPAGRGVFVLAGGGEVPAARLAVPAQQEGVFEGEGPGLVPGAEQRLAGEGEARRGGVQRAAHGEHGREGERENGSKQLAAHIYPPSRLKQAVKLPTMGSLYS